MAALGLTPASSAMARIKPMSAAGKASGSRSSRMAMYWAVHSPMPGRRRRVAIASSSEALGPNSRGSTATAAASADRDAVRARGIGRPDRSAPARAAAEGKTRVRPGKPGTGSSSGSP